LKFLIDGHRDRIALRAAQWPEGVAGQLLTPLTKYKIGHKTFAVDNGAFSELKILGLKVLLDRDKFRKNDCLFVAIPDMVGSHEESWELFKRYNYIANGWRKAFVAQDGFAGTPGGIHALFIGGTTEFKDSDEAIAIVKFYKNIGLHIHIGRVNTLERFQRFHLAGADTCDGSGVSRYDHMLPAIRDGLSC